MSQEDFSLNGYAESMIGCWTPATSPSGALLRRMRSAGAAVRKQVLGGDAELGDIEARMNCVPPHLGDSTPIVSFIFHGMARPLTTVGQHTD